ncbi:MAG: sodium-dependent bicarbonate transport family permease [Polaribacter sp.]
MDLHYLIDNLTNPALLFFFLGLVAVNIKSDLRIPENSSKFISLYLLLAIGFKGGQELAHSIITSEIIYSLLFGILLAIIVPIYCYFVLRVKLSVENSGAIASAYGSVSAVTFVTTISFLEMSQIPFGGHMVAVMALMEAPSIIVGVMLIAIFSSEKKNKHSFKDVIHHSLTNGSVVLIIGSLVVGYFTNDAQAEGIKPFTTDIFKGFLAVFLLDMGIVSGQKLKALLKKGWFTLSFSIFIPLINGCLVAILSVFL